MGTTQETVVTKSLLSSLTTRQKKIELEYSNRERTKGRTPIPVTVCHLCLKLIKIGDKLIMKTRGNRPRSRYHKECAITIKVI